MKASKCVVFLSVAFLVGQAGCGGNSLPLAEVAGSVTYQGAPVPGATVVFQPEGGPPAIANTDEQGRFDLNTGGRAGVMPGTSKVAITALEPMEHEVNAANLDDEIDAADAAAWESSMTAADLEAMASRKSLIPQKYSSTRTSGLSIEVNANEENEFNFELTD